MISIKEVLILVALFFSIGVYGVLTRRNTIGILMSIELLFNSACLSFVTFSKYYYPAFLKGQIFVLFIISVAAADTVVGLALLLCIYRKLKDVYVDRINIMKG
ncbi:MAG: NADH-quinone oxidoreductase subunit NuoK [Candidatus Stahlbacteria bacterium]|nr:NADH-quinone oxidoreductase subunit NuoK [Candidatus Stahlbacteria bacterium]